MRKILIAILLRNQKLKFVFGLSIGLYLIVVFFSLGGCGKVGYDSALLSASLLYQKDGETAGDNFGYSVTSGGDVNGDGKHDIIVGAPYVDSSEKTNVGSAYIYSGVNGSLLYKISGEDEYDLFGLRSSFLGDVDGDSKSDFIVSAPHAKISGKLYVGVIYIYSGTNGTLLSRITGEAASDYFGYAISSAGDINGDGKSDFIVGAPYADSFGSDAGAIYVYSGINGSLLYKISGEAASDNFGYAVSSGDVNSDGKNDFIVGAPSASPSGKSNAGSVYIYSGANGSLLFKINGEAQNISLGFSVSSGDVNGDGKYDIIAGSYIQSGGLEPPFIGQEAYRGLAYVYSGEDGSLLYKKVGETGFDDFGYSVSSSDVNGDGKADFIVGAPQADPSEKTNAGCLYVYSGIDGSLLYKIEGQVTGDYFGYSTSSGDVNGDGKSDFIIGAPQADPSGKSSAGSVCVYLSQ